MESPDIPEFDHIRAHGVLPSVAGATAVFRCALQMFFARQPLYSPDRGASDPHAP